MKRKDDLLELELDEIIEEGEIGTSFYEKEEVDNFLNDIEQRVTECHDLMDKKKDFSDLDDVLSKLDELKGDLY